MAIKCTTQLSDIYNHLQKFSEKVHKLILRRLTILGEECVKEARDRAPELSWYDQTGNLRSSIGYIIVFNGQIVKKSSFKKVKEGTDGPREGLALAKEIANDYSNGYALIVVAGMKYAAYVEAMENKNVLASAELYAESQVPVIKQALMKALFD